jgi:uncharacterized membrane protein YfcA
MSLFSLFPYDFSLWQWLAVSAGCVCFGISKTGLNNISVIAIPLFAFVFGAKGSTGTVLPLLCFADLFAVVYYRRHAEWKYVLRLVPWAVAGFGLALAADHFIESDRGFKILIGICVSAGLVIMFWNDFISPRLKKRFQNADREAENPPAPPGPEPARPQGSAHSPSPGESAPKPLAAWYAPLFGVLGGFSTMIGNSAGPIMSVFLLSVKLPKESFVGTAAWFFLIVNYLKVPLQAFAWRNISPQTLVFDLFMIPALLLGVWLGVLFVKKVSEVQYRFAVYALTLASSALLFL